MEATIINTEELIITDHAYERARERFGWRRDVLIKMAERAFMDGIRHSDTKGSLNRYITKLWFDYKNCNNVRIYGENIFFFCGRKLITVYRVEQKLIKHIKYCK